MRVETARTQRAAHAVGVAVESDGTVEDVFRGRVKILAGEHDAVELVGRGVAEFMDLGQWQSLDDELDDLFGHVSEVWAGF